MKAFVTPYVVPNTVKVRVVLHFQVTDEDCAALAAGAAAAARLMSAV